MKDDRDAGIIIPFAQNAEFYYQRGTKYLSEEKLERAEQYLRTAYEMEPDRSEYMLSFAETLHRMRMFEESLAVLIVSLNSTDIFTKLIYLPKSVRFRTRSIWLQSQLPFS